MTFELSTITWQSVGAVSSFVTAVLGIVISIMLRKGQHRREALTAFDNYRKEILDFANHVIDMMSQIQSLIATNPDKINIEQGNDYQDFFNRRSNLISEMSSLVDRGRFFFPNREEGKVGQEKGIANQGLRDPVLNRIISARYCVMAIDYNKFTLNSEPIHLKSLTRNHQRKGRDNNLYRAFIHLSKEEQNRLNNKPNNINMNDLIVSAKRSFVSEIFTIIQPRDWLKNVDEIYGISLRSRGVEIPALH